MASFAAAFEHQERTEDADPDGSDETGAHHFDAAEPVEIDCRQPALPWRMFSAIVVTEKELWYRFCRADRAATSSGLRAPRDAGQVEVRRWQRIASAPPSSRPTSESGSVGGNAR
mgnify:CR=1 FL=1